MADEPDSIILRYLHRIDENVARLADDMHDIKVRITSVEEGLAGVNRRLDRIERFERRADLIST